MTVIWRAAAHCPPPGNPARDTSRPEYRIGRRQPLDTAHAHDCKRDDVSDVSGATVLEHGGMPII
ncbi:MAG: hypothetical protein ACREFY_17470 [Acetobacteraceae bacterium]